MSEDQTPAEVSKQVVGGGGGGGGEGTGGIPQNVFSLSL